MKDLHKVRQSLIDNKLEVSDASLDYIGKNLVTIDDPVTAEKALKLLNALDDLDDVTNVYTNAHIVD